MRNAGQDGRGANRADVLLLRFLGRHGPDYPFAVRGTFPPDNAAPCTLKIQFDGRFHPLARRLGASPSGRVAAGSVGAGHGSILPQHVPSTR